MAICRHFGLDPNDAQWLRGPVKFDKPKLFAHLGLPSVTSTHDAHPSEVAAGAATLLILLRDPRDVVTSNWHSAGQSPEWPEHLETCTRKLARWAKSWRGCDRILWIGQYEQMQGWMFVFLRSLLPLLGVPDAENETIDFAVRAAAFDRMRALDPRRCRKGIVGDWKNHFTPAQHARLWEILDSQPCDYWGAYK